ncbi:hypothetical protein GJ496_007866, partial [Pomphorhynchus laevis]
KNKLLLFYLACLLILFNYILHKHYSPSTTELINNDHLRKLKCSYSRLSQLYVDTF